MRKNTLLLLLTLFITNLVFTQAPQGFKYQAAVRDSNGDLITNQAISVKVNILQTSASGNIVYSEEHAVESNSNGLVNLTIGNGSVLSGDFSTISWGNDDFFVQIMIDPEGGTNYIELGTSQLLSVPYSLYSEKSGEVGQYNSDTLFVVKDNQGNVVFAVFPDGAKVYVNEKDLKGPIGGFAVSGRNNTKGEYEVMRVTPDSARFYINEQAKGPIGGFAVSGRNNTKGTINDIFLTNQDSTRIYFRENAKGPIGGFAVSGRNNTKQGLDQYFNVSGSSTADTINPSQPMVLWYPKKEAFLTGRVLIESSDSVGTNSLASGFESKSIGNYSQALGHKARSFGSYSTSIGNLVNAEGLGALAAGRRSIAAGDYSVALGGVPEEAPSQTLAKGKASLAIGSESKAMSNYSIAMGDSTLADSIYAMAIGKNTVASGFASLAMGYHTMASGNYSTSLGNRTNALGKYSMAVGHSTQSGGNAALAMGRETYANGDYSMAIGDEATAEGIGSMALGIQSQATGASSFSFGQAVYATNDYAFAAGLNTTASGFGSRAMGPFLEVSGENSYGITLGTTGSVQEVTQPNTMAILLGNVGIGTNNPEYKLEVVGSINITGDYLTNGIKAKTADFVFDKDYTLESIEEHAAFMWRNKHLPAVKSQEQLKEQGVYSMSERREQILEELEKAHIYIEQLNNKIKKLEKQNKQKDQTINQQNTKLEQLNKKVNKILNKLEN